MSAEVAVAWGEAPSNGEATTTSVSVGGSMTGVARVYCLMDVVGTAAVTEVAVDAEGVEVTDDTAEEAAVEEVVEEVADEEAVVEEGAERRL